MAENPVLWSPDEARVRRSSMHRFMTAHGFERYEALYEWSTRDCAAFWSALVEFCDVRFERPPDTVLCRPDSIMDAGWFDGATLNYAEHQLRHRGSRPALIFRGENGDRRVLSFDELAAETAAVAAGLRAAGVERGDRVAGFLANGVEAIVAMLATTSLGATWSSCSPDFGANGVVDRFGQIEPVVLFTVDGYFYNGKTIGFEARLQHGGRRIRRVQSARRRARIRRGPVRSSAVHHVFVRYHRRAEMHRARSRRDAAAASQGTCAAYGPG